MAPRAKKKHLFDSFRILLTYPLVLLCIYIFINYKKYLIKNGFIKVGSVAPNDVMRKMYESAILVGGEIQNHNSENLLYNYLNAEPNTY